MNGTAEIIVLSIGAIVGFLSGLLGKGGSAIATPALQIFGHVMPFAALASPLPASLPTTIVASFAYRHEKLLDKRVVFTTIVLGIPATIIGSYFSHLLRGNVLMVITAVFVLALGVSFFIKSPGETAVTDQVPFWRILLVAIGVGLLSGLLANSGGILFGPLFMRFLHLPTKKAIACSLVVSAGLAIPGTVMHAYLGHIDWKIVLLLSIGSIPFAYLGAKASIKMKILHLKNIFGVMLILFGAFDLVYTLING